MIKQIKRITSISLLLMMFLTISISAAPDGEYWWGNETINSNWKTVSTQTRTNSVDNYIRVQSKWSNVPNFKMNLRVISSDGSVVLKPRIQHSTNSSEDINETYSNEKSMPSGKPYRLQVRRENFWDPQTHITGRWTP